MRTAKSSSAFSGAAGIYTAVLVVCHVNGTLDVASGHGVPVFSLGIRCDDDETPAIHSGPRAVGNACGANPYLLIVPCHRVIAAHQALGGFGRGKGDFLLEVKKRLLQHERR